MIYSLTLSAVKYAALLLIDRDSQTTTLDVKNLLRKLDYIATQDDVSVLMDQAASELPLEFTSSKGYREFTLPTPASVVAPAAQIQPLTVSNVITYEKRSGDVIVGSTNDLTAIIGDWCVTSDTSDKVAYFTGSYSRDDVRQAYARTFDVGFHTTRSTRIK